MSVPAHVFLAHFPVALVLTGAAGDALGAILPRQGLRSAAGALLVLGAAAAVLTFFTGDAAGFALSRHPGTDHPLIETHTQWAVAGLWAIAGGGALRLAWRERLGGWHGWLLLAIAILSGALVIGIALSGAALAHS